MIEKIMPGTKVKMRVLNAIYQNPGINITKLIKKVRASPNFVIKYVNNLVGYNITKERRLGGKKKTHYRELRADFSSELSRSIFASVEIDKRQAFIKKYKELKPFVEQLRELFDENIKFALIYGSFARFSAEKASDVDLLIVGKVSSELKKRLSEVFVTLDREISIKIENYRDFLKKAREPLHQTMLREHVIIYGETRFIESLERLTTNRE